MISKYFNMHEAFMEHIKIEKDFSKNTVEAYANDLKSFIGYIEEKELEINTDNILLFLSKESNKRTLNRRLSSINSFLKFCNNEGFLKQSVNIKQSKIPKNLPKNIDSDKIIDIVKNIDDTKWIGSRDKALILFLYATGVRVSEASNMLDSDLVDNWVRIRMGKGDKERMVPIADVAIDAIKLYKTKAKSVSKFLWTNYKGNRLSRVSIFKITKKYLGVSPHALRHSFATSLVLGGADLIVVQELLGHASTNTTQIYTHIKQKHMAEIMNLSHPLKGIL